MTVMTMLSGRAAEGAATVREYGEIEETVTLEGTMITATSPNGRVPGPMTSMIGQHKAEWAVETQPGITIAYPASMTITRTVKPQFLPSKTAT